MLAASFGTSIPHARARFRSVHEGSKSRNCLLVSMCAFVDLKRASTSSNLWNMMRRHAGCLSNDPRCHDSCCLGI